MNRNGLVWIAVATATLVLSGCAAALVGKATSSGTYGGGPGSQKSSGSSQQGKASTSTTPAGGAARGAPTPSGARTSAQMEQDRQIVVSVRNRLSADAGTKALAIEVETYQGVVTLFGDVSKSEQRFAAERIARGVAGVRNVRNELRVR